MVEKIIEFYRTAEDGKLPGKYDQELFNEVKKYSTSTSKAIKEIVAAQKTTNALDCILAYFAPSAVGRPHSPALSSQLSGVPSSFSGKRIR